jgi:hypothetical protein
VVASATLGQHGGKGVPTNKPLTKLPRVEVKKDIWGLCVHEKPKKDDCSRAGCEGRWQVAAWDGYLLEGDWV